MNSGLLSVSGPALFLHCVPAFHVEHTTFISAVDEYDITNVSAQTEDVTVPAVTVAVLRQH